LPTSHWLHHLLARRSLLVFLLALSPANDQWQPPSRPVIGRHHFKFWLGTKEI
jgi:hypothetical protein